MSEPHHTRLGDRKSLQFPSIGFVRGDPRAAAWSTHTTRVVGVGGPHQLSGFCRNPGERWYCWASRVGGEDADLAVDLTGKL